MKYSYEEKLRTVLAVLVENRAIHSISKQTGIAKKTIRHWIAFYQEYGTEGLQLKKVNTHYSREFKLSVLKHMHENHLSFLETAVKFGISNDSTIYKWHRIYSEKEASVFLHGDEQQLSKKRTTKVNSNNQSKDQSKEDLIAENQYLRAENAYLKKLKALVQERIAREQKNK